MFAVIKSGGKQYRVETGTVVDVELLDAGAGDKIELRDVLLVSDGDKVSVGSPLVTGARVEVEVLGETKGPKVISFKKIKRHGKQWKRGHRQRYTSLKVTKIIAA
ncbi:MAG: 50S ribosomal protein L21 [Deltaproteobacteria bacterium]|nr:50S ribosomal protein L21 [Deltaproteobacteria bacterium]